MDPKRLKPLHVSLFIGIAFVACVLIITSSSWFESPTTQVHTNWRDVIRIGYAIEPPYAFLDSQGRVTGEAPEVAGVVARRAGIRTVRFVLCDFGDLIDSLIAGEIDMIAAGMFITPERAKRIDFSRPTTVVHPALLVARGNPQGLHSYVSIAANAKITVAALQGAVEHGQLLEAGVPASRIVVVHNAQAGVDALRKQAVAAFALSEPSLRYIATRNPDKYEVAAPFSPGRTPSSPPAVCAFAFRKDSDEMREAFNDILASYLGSAEHLELITPFGFGLHTLPDTSTP